LFREDSKKKTVTTETARGRRGSQDEELVHNLREKEKIKSL